MPPKRRRIESTSSGSSISTRILRETRASTLVGGDPAAPTRKEWEEMNAYSVFVALDDEKEEHRFPLDNYALVLPEGADPECPPKLRDYWVGKIKEIRSRQRDPTEVWVKIQWLWSIGELVKLKPRIDLSSFGLMERILSNHFDFVHSSSFAGLAQVRPYVEADPEPHAINDETFYYRSTFDIYSGEVQSLPVATCFCGEAYNPNDSAVMHFCPRNGCCRAFHADCLRQSGYVEKPRKDMHALRAQRALQFERTLPSDEDEDEDEGNEEDNTTPRPPTPNSLASGSLPNGPQSPSCRRPDRHSELPDPLLALARSPMVKGLGTDLPYEWSCVTGNPAVISRARKLVRDALEGKNSRLPLKWRTLLELPGEETTSDDLIDESKVRAWVVRDDNLFLCPVCKGAI